MKANPVKINKVRDLTPNVRSVNIVTLVENNSAFAFKLYQATGIETNLLISPFSISETLAMTYAGARNKTEQDIAQTLFFNLPRNILHPAFNFLDLQLKQPANNTEESFQLNKVNTIWGQKDYSFLPGFLETLAENYGSGLVTMDFTDNIEKARTAINNWVSEQTDGKINDLVAEGTVNSLTRLLLTNAIYFKSLWKYAFDKNMTQEDTFHVFDKADISVQMMRQTKLLPYVERDIYQAVELPYRNDEYSMLIILPGSGQFNSFEKALDNILIKKIVEDLRMHNVRLTIPKFKIESGFSLKETLSKMGMESAFTGEADFSGMNGNTELYLQDVLHKAFIAIDENGTEAAAASTAIVGLKSALIPLVSIELKIDRPFIFIIRHIHTSSVLFVGKVINPINNIDH